MHCMLKRVFFMEEVKEKVQHHLDQAKKLRHGGQSIEAISLLMDALMLCQNSTIVKVKYRPWVILGWHIKTLVVLKKPLDICVVPSPNHASFSLWSELEVSLTNLGSALSELGRMQDALPVYDEARALCVNHNDLSGLAKCEIFLGNTHLRLGHLEIAETHYKKAAELYRQVNDPLNQAHLNINLGALAHRRSDYKTATNLFQNALIGYRKAKNVRGILTALNNLGGVLMDSEQFDEAIDYLEEAMQLAKEGGLADFAWRIAGNIAEWHRHQNNLLGALDSYKDAVNLLDDLRTQLRMRSSRLDFVEQRLSRYADLIYFAVHEAKQTTFALEFAERIRGRVFIEELALSSVSKPRALSHDWLERERFLLNQIKEIQDVALTVEILNRVKAIQQQLETHWYNAFDKDSEYISLRLGEPILWPEIQEVLLE